MKKTLIALMALAGVASADTTWTFDGNLTSTGTKVISTSATEAYSYEKEETNESTGETVIKTEWGRREANVSYIDSGLTVGTAIGNYVLHEAKGQAVDLTSTSTGGTKWLSLDSNYYAGGDGKLVVGQADTANNTNFTIMAYVKFDNIAGEQFIFGTGGTNQHGLAFGIKDGQLDILRKWKGHDQLTMEALEADVWYHLAVSYTASTNSAEFFVNGDSVGSLTLNAPNAGFATPGTNVGAAIGAGAQDTVTTGNFHGPQGGLDGYLAEVKVFNSTLTKGQILVAANLVPEPTTATLSLLALVGLAARRRRH